MTGLGADLRCVCAENFICAGGESEFAIGMIARIRLVLSVLASLFKSKRRLEAENAALREQVIGLLRKVKGRPRLTNTNRWFFVQLYRGLPSIVEVLAIIRPETLMRWHRASPRRRFRRSRGRVVTLSVSSSAKHVARHANRAKNVSLAV